MTKFRLLQQLHKQLGFLQRIPLLPQFVDEQLKIGTLLFRPKVYEKMMQLIQQLKQWPQITTQYHKYGGLEFRIQGNEIAHLHGNGLLDIIFPLKFRKALVMLDGIEPHHVLETSGWISVYLSAHTNLTQVFQLLNWAYRYHSQADHWTVLLAEMEALNGEKDKTAQIKHLNN